MLRFNDAGQGGRFGPGRGSGTGEDQEEGGAGRGVASDRSVLPHGAPVGRNPRASGCFRQLERDHGVYGPEPSTTSLSPRTTAHHRAPPRTTTAPRYDTFQQSS